jgi:hypothetical protein
MRFSHDDKSHAARAKTSFNDAQPISEFLVVQIASGLAFDTDQPAVVVLDDRIRRVAEIVGRLRRPPPSRVAACIRRRLAKMPPNC